MEEEIYELQDMQNISDIEFSELNNYNLIKHDLELLYINLIKYCKSMSFLDFNKIHNQLYDNITQLLYKINKNLENIKKFNIKEKNNIKFIYNLLKLKNYYINKLNHDEDKYSSNFINEINKTGNHVFEGIFYGIKNYIYYVIKYINSNNRYKLKNLINYYYSLIFNNLEIIDIYLYKMVYDKYLFEGISILPLEITIDIEKNHEYYDKIIVKAEMGIGKTKILNDINYNSITNYYKKPTYKDYIMFLISNLHIYKSHDFDQFVNIYILHAVELLNKKNNPNDINNIIENYINKINVIINNKLLNKKDILIIFDYIKEIEYIFKLMKKFENTYPEKYFLKYKNHLNENFGILVNKELILNLIRYYISSIKDNCILNNSIPVDIVHIEKNEIFCFIKDKKEIEKYIKKIIYTFQKKI